MRSCWDCEPRTVVILPLQTWCRLYTASFDFWPRAMSGSSLERALMRAEAFDAEPRMGARSTARARVREVG